MTSQIPPETPSSTPKKTCKTKDPCTGRTRTFKSDKCPAGTESGCSVLLSSGQFVFRKELLQVGSIGSGGWGFSLDYLPGNNIEGALGKNFNYPQNVYLEQKGSDIELVGDDNTRTLFEEVGGGVYRDDSGWELTRVNGGTSDEFYNLPTSDGSLNIFYGLDSEVATPGRLKSVSDRYGDTKTLEWEVVGGDVQLSRMVDSYGREIVYSYYGSEASYRLKEVEDFLGRKLNFQYDDDDRLVAAVTPSINKAAEGNTFPGGTAYVFQYDSDNPRDDRRDDLIRIWYPNEVAPYVDAATRSVDIAQVYANATAYYTVEYGQDSTDEDHYGRVIRETIGDPAPGSATGGTYSYMYTLDGLTSSIFSGNSWDDITKRTVMTDPNGNQTIYEFNENDMETRVEVLPNRGKNSHDTSGFVTWKRYNDLGQEVLVIYPEGNSVEYSYDDGVVSGITDPHGPRVGLLKTETAKPYNDYSVADNRGGSNGQTELTKRYFYEPIFNQQCAVIEYRGNPIAGDGSYFTPQNLGTTPTDADRSRYATITYFDYQKNTLATVKNDSSLQTKLGLTAAQIQALINHVDAEMKATDGTGGIPAGFEMNLGDINGSGTGDGNSSGLGAAGILGNVIKVGHPSVRLVDGSSQQRVELFTVNDRGQNTTHTDAEGNITIYVRYPENDPEGDGRYVAEGLSTRQYGRIREIHADADPDDIMTLIGADGDLADFVTTVAPRNSRTNTVGEYQDLVTKYESANGCSTCSYDALGNVLTETDARGFTTIHDRNEIGKVYRTTSPAPYDYRKEIHYDANGNVTREDIEDIVVDYSSDDPTNALYAKFTPSMNTALGVAHVPTKAGKGGTVRPGWFTNLYEYDILNNKIEEDIDATGSQPANLVTSYEYDRNSQLVKITKPEGNIVEFDYDERGLQIAQRVGYDDAEGVDGLVTVSVYNDNGNLLNQVGTGDRDGSSLNNLTVTIEDAFGSGDELTHAGEMLVENAYDGFDRVISSKDAVGNVVEYTHAPDGRVIEILQKGPIGGATPSDLNGTNNVDLAKSYVRFDEAGRQYEMQRDVFVATGVTLPSSRAVTHTGGGLLVNSTADTHTGQVTLSSGGSSYILGRSEYDRADRLVKQVADNTGEATYEYDGADRVVKITDADGNVSENAYDPNGNVIAATRTETCTITAPSVADETFASAMFYDALGRAVLLAVQGADGVLDTDLSADNNETLFTLIGYDSRGNRTLVIEPKGNTSITIYDAAGRVTETHQHMRSEGSGDNGPASASTFLAAGTDTVRTQMVYDMNNRLRHLIDDAGATTAYAYDTLDRQTSQKFHDGNERTITFTDAGDIATYTDENGSVFTPSYDGLGRMTAISISKGSGVVGTASQTVEYDGLGRMTRAIDTDGSSPAECKFYFDSLGRVIEDSQIFGGNTRNVTHNAFTSAPATGLTYPNNRAITLGYDSLYRRTSVADGGGNIAEWDYFGPSRVAEVTLGNGLACSHMNNARTHSAVQSSVANPAWGTTPATDDRLGYDGAGRMITKRYVDSTLGGSNEYSDPTPVVGFTTAFDKSSNKNYERHLHAENRSHLYNSLDSMNRLRDFLYKKRGTLATGWRSVASLHFYSKFCSSHCMSHSL